MSAIKLDFNAPSKAYFLLSLVLFVF